ncbi:23S rRNA (guanosine(2251)-2'-O)-methyltransferase RlmB [Cytophagales bacterium LB-30]|uniref:23S rRNA (Guanosine(2251)-2'-O)-methyltransferase RlmB n=1 Tax=Shiella aurantiaca TaxID=3058365 RepID=A0ABT8F7N6_9BACT|nr:23S rRNA (guanosine(2251)-2'-O)-methyltransferase RlmB [Shiella aurantiaca]MDN4166400.1 23S rRNA (guanosine(2251)-2'-O)-methyltransferase RlmB [Shiella aurantiaca]
MEKRKKVDKPGFKHFKPAFTENKDLVFGTRAIIEAIRAGKEVDKLLIQKGLTNELTTELINEATQAGVPIQKVPVEKLNKLTRKNHQGAVCYLSVIRYAPVAEVVSACFEKGVDPFLVILDRITDVRNFGAVARTADCAGVHALVIPDKGSAQIGSDAMKTSAGALNFLSVCREHNLKDTIRYLKDSGLKIIACTEKGEQNLYELDLKGPVAIIMGSEEDGISPEYLRLADFKGKIPMVGNIESLNISVAAGVAMYEVVRQKGL